jgi:hypothetical protein
MSTIHHPPPAAKPATMSTSSGKRTAEPTELPPSATTTKLTPPQKQELQLPSFRALMGWTFVMLTYVHLGKAFAPCHDLFYYTSGTFVVSTIFAMSAEREVGAFIMYTYTAMNSR